MIVERGVGQAERKGLVQVIKDGMDVPLRQRLAEAQGRLGIVPSGLDNAEPRIPQSTTPTSFRQSCEDVLKPAVFA